MGNGKQLIILLEWPYVTRFGKSIFLINNSNLMKYYMKYYTKGT